MNESVMNEPAVEWLDDDEMRAWRGLVEVYADVHAALEAELLEGFGFQNGTNGPSAHLDGDPIPHQRLYQLTACSIPLLLLRMPPVRRWVARKQKEGKQRVVYLTFLPLAALFIISYSFIINELMFKGISAFREQPVNG